MSVSFAPSILRPSCVLHHQTIPRHRCHVSQYRSQPPQHQLSFRQFSKFILPPNSSSLFCLSPHLLPLLSVRQTRQFKSTTSVTMGIKGLTKLLGDNAPSCSKPQEAQSLFGRKIAIDASMCIYQLLVAVRMGSDNLTNDDGSVTSHLSGLFYRVIRLLELGIKPIFVFDGEPPEMKAGELQKRAQAKKLAEEAALKAKDEGDLEMAAKFSRRVNRITPQMIDACKSLLQLMGIPIVNAPCEAEAQCAELVKSNMAYATASEDMDSLTFGTTKLIRAIWAGTASTANKKGVKPVEYALDVALKELELDMSKFIDLCILCGCDYVDPIKGVGVVKALSLVRKYHSLEKIIPVLRAEKKGYQVPEEYPIEDIRKMFVQPKVTPGKDITLKWSAPKYEQLRTFLVEENQFDTTKVDNAFKRLVAARKTSSQVRVDSFFTKAPSNASSIKGASNNKSKLGTPVKGTKKSTTTKAAGKKRTSTSPASGTTPRKKLKKDT